MSSAIDNPVCTVNNHVPRTITTSRLLALVFVLITHMRVYRITLIISYPTDVRYGESLPNSNSLVAFHRFKFHPHLLIGYLD